MSRDRKAPGRAVEGKRGRGGEAATIGITHFGQIVRIAIDDDPETLCIVVLLYIGVVQHCTGIGLFSAGRKWRRSGGGGSGLVWLHVLLASLTGPIYVLVSLMREVSA